MFNFALASFVVFLINLIATVWGFVSNQTTRGAFYEGDCDRVKALDSGIHVPMNVLGTVLLAGSNYCMHGLSAPTREEINKVHGSSSGDWLEIGVTDILVTSRLLYGSPR